MKKQVCSIAAFLIFLIVTIPLLTANAYAELISVKIYNYNNIEGYASKADSYTVEAVAKIDGDANITRNQVNLGNNSFGFCNPLNLAQGTFICRYTSYTDLLSADVHTLNVQLKDDAQNTVSSKSAALIIDDIAPEMTDFILSQKNINENLTIKFTAKDSACLSSACKGKCSGIQDIKFLAGDSEIAYLNVSSSECEKSGTASANISSYDGLLLICGQASDRVEKLSQRKCSNLTIDRQGPTIDAPELTDSLGNNLLFGKGATFISIAVNVSDNAGISLSTVSVDIKDLLKEKAEVRRTADCTAISKTSAQCRLALDAQINSDKSGSLIITAEDPLGNSATAGYPFAIGYDNESPAVEFLGTTAPNESFAKFGQNTFIAKITEAQSGISKKNVLLDLSDFNMRVNVEADECILTTQWFCFWYNVSMTEKEYLSRTGYSSSSVTLNLRDNAGNSASGKTSARIIIDTGIPIISNFTQIAEGLADPQCPVPGETPSYNFIVNDSSAIVVSANVSAISESENAEAGCQILEAGSETDLGKLWNCTLPISGLKSGPNTTEIKFNVIDAAGNIATFSKAISICAGDQNTVPNFFRAEVKNVAPDKIDRKIASKTAVSVFIPIQLSGSAKIIKANVEACGKEAEKKELSKLAQKEGQKAQLQKTQSPKEVGQQNTEAKTFVDNSQPPYLLNTRSNNPVIVLKIAKDDYKNIQNAEITCRLSLTVRKGGTVYLKPEIETVSVKIPFYNLPTGYIEDNIQAKIDREKSEIKSLEEQIKSRQESKDAFKDTCRMLKVYAQISNTIHSIAQTLKTLACLLSFSPFTRPASESLKKTADSLTKIFEGTIGGILNNVLSPLKLVCAMYSGKYCDPDAIADVAYTAFGTGLEQKLESAVSFRIDNKVQTNIPGREAPQYSGTSIIENPPTQWAWDPYKSIHYARACNFVPAEIYNYKKLKQIKCMYVNCLEQRAKAGLSTYVCDSAKEQRICLYYDSAQYRMAGLNMGNYLVKIIESFVKKLFTNFLNKLICNKLGSFKPAEGKDACSGIADSWCALYNSMQRLLHIGDLFSGFQGFGDKDTEVSLGGQDYCTGIA